MAILHRSGRDRGLAAAVPQEPTDLSVEVPQDATDAAAIAAARSPSHRRLPWLAVIAGVLVVPLALAFGITWTAPGLAGAARAADAQVVSAADMEQEYGIKVTLVAVIAAGGLIDLRFTVVDKGKAEHFLHDSATLPALYVESSGAVLRTSRAKAHKMTVLDGASYFVLYPNSGGAIQAGTGVSVVIEGIRLAPVAAQS